MNIEWVDTKSLKPNPKNRNNHSPEQVERLAKIIQYQGWRFPIIADKTNTIWAGHGRLLAAKKLKLGTVPVSYQDFLSEEQAYAFLVSDNAIASWAELDLSGINSDLGDLGPDFDLGLLGLQNFTLDVADKLNPSEEWTDMPEFTQEDKTSYRHVTVHFLNEEHAKRFFRAIDQLDTGNTRSLWYPPQKNMTTESKRYEG